VYRKAGKPKEKMVSNAARSPDDSPADFDPAKMVRSVKAIIWAAKKKKKSAVILDSNWNLGR